MLMSHGKILVKPDVRINKQPNGFLVDFHPTLHSPCVFSEVVWLEAVAVPSPLRLAKTAAAGEDRQLRSPFLFHVTVQPKVSKEEAIEASRE